MRGGVSGAKRNKGANSNNNKSPHKAGVAIANASNKPMVEMECFGCGMKGHTINDCRKISVETKKELMSQGHFRMSCRIMVKNANGGS